MFLVLSPRWLQEVEALPLFKDNSIFSMNVLYADNEYIPNVDTVMIDLVNMHTARKMKDKLASLGRIWDLPLIGSHIL